tara:strand:+ start:3840 stop:4253 length:414 start_codon:yes stop_codon:yes gene_type:complete
LTDIADTQDAPGDAGTQAMRLAGEVAALGEAMGLPYIAVSADIGSPEPMCDLSGRPLAETLFRWIDPQLAYWKDRAFALRSGYVRGRVPALNLSSTQTSRSAAGARSQRWTDWHRQCRPRTTVSGRQSFRPATCHPA